MAAIHVILPSIENEHPSTNIYDGVRLIDRENTECTENVSNAY